MQLKPIKTSAEHEAALAWSEAQSDAGVSPDTPAGKKLQAALLLIKQYEDEYYLTFPPGTFGRYPRQDAVRYLKRFGNSSHLPASLHLEAIHFVPLSKPDSYRISLSEMATLHVMQ